MHGTIDNKPKRKRFNLIEKFVNSLFDGSTWSIPFEGWTMFFELTPASGNELNIKYKNKTYIMNVEQARENALFDKRLTLRERLRIYPAVDYKFDNEDTTYRTLILGFKRLLFIIENMHDDMFLDRCKNPNPFYRAPKIVL